MDPDQPTDEEQQVVEETPAPAETVNEEEAPTEPPTKEAPPKEPAPEEPPAEEEPEAEQAEEEAPTPPSRREQLRVQDLLRKYGPPSDKAPLQETKPDFRDKITADDDAYKAMEETAEQFARGRESQVLAQAETRMWRRFLATEDSQVRSKYPELDGSNQEKFHPALADAINRRYLRMVGWQPGDPQKGMPETVANPDLSYAEFVEAEMEYIDEAASLKLTNTTRNITKQVAQTGLRPDGSSPKQRFDLSKAPSEMTDEELSAAINATMPRDAKGRFVSQK